MAYLKVFIVFIILSIVHIQISENAIVLTSFYEYLQTSYEYDLVKYAFDCKECYVIYKRSDDGHQRILSAEMIHDISVKDGRLTVFMPRGNRKGTSIYEGWENWDKYRIIYDPI